VPSRSICRTISAHRKVLDIASHVGQSFPHFSFTSCFLFSFILFPTHCAMASSASVEIPSSILIVGSGAFGLSTAWSLCRNPLYKNTSITVVDRQPFPTPDGSSVSSIVQYIGYKMQPTRCRMSTSERTKDLQQRPTAQTRHIDRYLSHHPTRLRSRALHSSRYHRPESLAHRLRMRTLS
jgi:hypothetical protein